MISILVVALWLAGCAEKKPVHIERFTGHDEFYTWQCIYDPWKYSGSDDLRIYEPACFRALTPKR